MGDTMGNRGYLVLLILVSMLIMVQALAIGRDDNQFEKPVLTVSTVFRTPSDLLPRTKAAPVDLAPANFEPGALDTLPGEEDETCAVRDETRCTDTTCSEDEAASPAGCTRRSIPVSEAAEAPGEGHASAAELSSTACVQNESPPVRSIARKLQDPAETTEQVSPTEKRQESLPDGLSSKTGERRLHGNKTDGRSCPSRAKTIGDGAISRSTVEYRVRRGDSLWRLARTYGTTVEAIRLVNSIRGNGNLKPGQTLKIPVDRTSASKTTPGKATSRSFKRTATYEVQPGDNLYTIAKKFKTSVASLLINNNISAPERLWPGQILQITKANRIVHIVNKGESLWELSKLYSIDLDELMKYNNLDYKTIYPGQRIAIPVRDPKTLRPLFARRRRNTFRRPFKGRLVEKFGWRIHPILHRRLFHCGIDLAAPSGTRIGAIADGVVTFAGWLKGYGNVVVVKHRGGYSSRYGHCRTLEVTVGQRVKTGQKIATVGSTGLSTGPHLHLEVRLHGRPLDPLDFVSV